jgi:hypothetical protein
VASVNINRLVWMALLFTPVLSAQVTINTSSTTFTAAAPKLSGTAACKTAGQIVSAITVTSGALTVTCIPMPAGVAGPAGPIGKTGATGGVGAVGAVGATGSIGPMGPIGPSGVAGIQGAPGLPGAIGAQGPIGLTGPAGIVGPSGAAGASVVGPPGPDGSIGPQGIQGVVGPAGSVGPPGVAGAAGANGVAGTPGPAGIQGVQGLPGVAGAPGSSGIAGSPGVAGAVGATGLQGPIGLTGPAGPSGPSGSGTGPVATPGFGLIADSTGKLAINTAVTLDYLDAMAAAPFDCVSTNGTIQFTCSLKVAPTVPPVLVLLTTSVNCPGACTLSVVGTGKIVAIKTNAAGATDAPVAPGSHLLRYDSSTGIYRLLL